MASIAIMRLLLTAVFASVLISVVESRPKPNLRMLHEILEERRNEIEQELETIDDLMETRNLLKKLSRNRRRASEIVTAELKSVKRTRCYFNPITC
ncbi:hypothetical protein L596_024174 [Steinernema carpocapsae]|uniref:Uncharacterized protein n=1 Tax=Steinernema carpocapsae TaxID=34508 RepID=A0A4U5MGN7_STECR|nr:hypothetical protein L596_024174 [Steinernema carpocapsae]